MTAAAITLVIAAGLIQRFHAVVAAFFSAAADQSLRDELRTRRDLKIAPF